MGDTRKRWTGENRVNNAEKIKGKIFYVRKDGQRGEHMHSKIFQISQKPIEDRISEDRYYYGFVGKVADYVSELDTDDQLNSISWLAETPGIRVNNIDGMATITVVDKKAYFTTKLTEFKNALKRLEKISLDDFIANSGALETGM